MMMIVLCALWFFFLLFFHFISVSHPRHRDKKKKLHENERKKQKIIIHWTIFQWQKFLHFISFMFRFVYLAFEMKFVIFFYFSILSRCVLYLYIISFHLFHLFMFGALSFSFHFVLDLFGRLFCFVVSFVNDNEISSSLSYCIYIYMYRWHCYVLFVTLIALFFHFFASFVAIFLPSSSGGRLFEFYLRATQLFMTWFCSLLHLARALSLTQHQTREEKKKIQIPFQFLCHPFGSTLWSWALD